MAIEKQDLKFIVKSRSANADGKKLCILGDCYFHFNNRELQEISGTNIGNEFNLDEKPNIKSVAKALGFDAAETIDIEGSPTIKTDLEKPFGSKYISNYDWIIDAGTLYWCLDIQAVMYNITQMLKSGGLVLHISALSGYFGRGNYSFNPKLFTELYQKSGFEILTLAYRLRPSHYLYSRNRLSYTLKKFIGKAVDIEKRLEWQEFPPENMFLNKASRFGMEFGRSQILPEPDMIPNNALIACLARKINE